MAHTVAAGLTPMGAGFRVSLQRLALHLQSFYVILIKHIRNSKQTPHNTPPIISAVFIKDQQLHGLRYGFKMFMGIIEL